MKRLVCLTLVLLMMLSLIPMSASASEDTATVTVNIFYLKGRYYGTYTFTVGSEPKVMYAEDYIRVSKAVYEFECFRVGDWYPTELMIPAYDGTESWKDQWSNIEIFYDKHTHSYAPGYDRKHHWDGCACGEIINKKPHVDPAKDEDKVCDCGYVFSNNADLVTLWLDGMVLSTRFDKNITEYTANVHTYKDVTATQIRAAAFDALATIELPKDLALKEGANTFQITVTAEDKTTTKTYTVTAVKASKVQGLELPSDGESVSVAPNYRPKWDSAIIDLSDAVGIKLAQLAERDGCSQILIQPAFSKWGVNTAIFNVSAKVLTEMAEKAKADLVLETTYGVDVVIPHDALSELAGKGELITVTIEKEGTFTIQADSEDIAQIPEAIEVSID